MVVNYHRVGDADATRYDSGVFSATAEQFRSQMEYLAEHLKPVTLEETLSFLEGKDGESRTGCRVLVTFDDGYVDNFQIAFPILRDLGIQGVFFLPTAFIGTDKIPSWDRVAYLVKSARNRNFSLSYPVETRFDIAADGVYEVARRVVNLLRELPANDLARAIEELERACRGDQPNPRLDRCFMNWGEVAQMMEGGMAIGAHTHTHRLLGPLPEEEQRKELMESRTLLREQVGVDVQTLAYPLGSASSFTEQTKRLAEQTGYRGAFSNYGGINSLRGMERFDIRRVSVDKRSVQRFQTQASIGAVANFFWP